MVTTDDINVARNRILNDSNKIFPNTTFGTWEIWSEEAAAGIPGIPTTTLLEIVEGRFLDVVEYAVHLPDFFSWGRGGEVKRAKTSNKVIPVGYRWSDDKDKASKDKERILKEIKRLQEELNQLTTKFGV